MILFSKKSKVPTIYKALTGHFKDKMRFAFVASDKKDILANFNVEKFSTVIVLKSYNPEEDKIEE